MNTPPSQESAVIQRPNLIACFRKGFDSVANHIEILLFPIVLDLFLWLGPHVTIRSLAEQGVEALNQIMVQESSFPEEALAASQQTWQTFAEHFNLLGLLRTLPVGIPSLMASQAPILTPIGAPVFVELTSLTSVVLFVALVVLSGLAVGAVYFLLVAQVSATNKVDWAVILREWPLAATRSVGLLLLLIGILILITLPVSCVLGTLALSGLMFSQIGTFVYGVILVWWMVPLIFSAHGIFLYRDKLWLAVRRSIHLTRLTFPVTGTLILSMLLISEGLDVLWSTPKAESWLMLLGVAGHAFITTALLAASFVYFHQTNLWLQSQAWTSLKPVNRGESV